MAELLSIQVNVPLIKSNLMPGKLVEMKSGYAEGGVEIKDKSEPSFLSNEAGIETLPTHRAVNIEFNSLVYSVVEERRKFNLQKFFECEKNYKTILHSISGKFKSGHLTAIMGPSGAGKSSLMDILAGFRTKSVTGEIMVNNEERDLRKFRKQSCYIMQNDDLLPNLSVNEMMMCSVNLKLPEKFSVKKKKAVVTKILKVLNLEEAKNTYSCKLSGGQRKRLSIAIELVNNPPVMFFDEPTSGLDSASCLQCIMLLKSLANGGRTIICTIHQPSARLFELFDHLYMMSEGQCIYQGCVPGLVPYLAGYNLICPPYHNLADYVIEVACGEFGDLVPVLSEAVKMGYCEKYKSYCKLPNIFKTSQESSYLNDDKSLSLETKLMTEKETLTKNSSSDDKEKLENDINPIDVFICSSSLSEDADSSTSHTFVTSFTTQFCVLFVRTFRSIMRDTTLTLLRFLSHIVVGALMGLMYYRIGDDASMTHNNAGFLFFTLLFVTYTALMPTVLTFPMEMSIFMREHLNYWYSVKAYYFAKTMADLPFQIAFPVIYGSIVYWMTDQPAEASRFLMFLCVCVLTSLVAQALGLFIGASTSLQVAIFIGPISTIPLILFCGFFVNLGSMSIYLSWLSYLSFSRYGFFGVMKAIYGLDRSDLTSTKPEDDIFSCAVYRKPEMFLKTFDIEENKFYLEVIWLVIYFLVLRIASFIVLKLRVRTR